MGIVISRNALLSAPTQAELYFLCNEKTPLKSMNRAVNLRLDSFFFFAKRVATHSACVITVITITPGSKTVR